MDDVERGENIVNYGNEEDVERGRIKCAFVAQYNSCLTSTIHY